MSLSIKYKKLEPDAPELVRSSKEAAGYDLRAYLNEVDGDHKVASVICEIPPHSTRIIRTGLAMAIPHGYFGGIFARSGIASNSGLRPANCVGVIDSDYRGEVKVALHNDTDLFQNIINGERIAQIVILPCPEVEFYAVKNLDETERGSGGFGSTGR